MNAVWNGKEALDYLLEEHSDQRPRPDLILMDVQMPILDGYRATHLIRHHSPYNSVPGIQQTPIVAMTASAIQGDREKCERAGMDDYLAKPVRSHTLESMLVKWALKVKSSDVDSKSFHSAHTDADSNCTDLHAISPPLKPTTPTHTTATPSTSLRRQIQARALVGTVDRLPSAENEGDRGLRRVAAEEKALELRNDKLLSAADEEPHAISHSGPHTLHAQLSPSAELTPEPAPIALTEENVGKLGKQRNRDQHGNATVDVEEGDEDDEGEPPRSRERSGAEHSRNISLSAYRGSISEEPTNVSADSSSYSAKAGTSGSSDAAGSGGLSVGIPSVSSPLVSPPLVVDEDEGSLSVKKGDKTAIGNTNKKGETSSSLRRPQRAAVERMSSSKTVTPHNR